MRAKMHGPRAYFPMSKNEHTFQAYLTYNLQFHNNNQHLYSAFCQMMQSQLPIIKVLGKSTVIFASPKGATGQMHTLSAVRL